MTRRGFTIVELIITITIMGILLTLAVVNVGSTQLKARDDKRATSVAAIGNYLDSYYTNGVPIIGDIDTTINRIGNPSFETNTVINTAYAFVALAQTSAWSSDGTYSMSVTPNNASTDSFAAPGGDVGAMRMGMTAGKTYTMSAILRIPATLTGTLDGNRATCIMAFWYVSGGYQSAKSCGGSANVGTYPLSLTFSLPAGATEAFIRLYHGGNTGTGPVYYDSLMLTEGTTRYDYADGDMDGWIWNGTPNESSSTGPVVVAGIPGTYPSVSITSSPLLTLYLPDADVKSFIAPGKSNPYETFIPATNSVQTEAGVLPQPTIDQYVYQPIDSDASLCGSRDCRKYNIYYRRESDNAVVKVMSKNQ